MIAISVKGTPENESVLLSPHCHVCSPERGQTQIVPLFNFTVCSTLTSRQDSSQLKDLWKKICHNSTGMEFQDHRYWLRTYPNCIVGKEFVNWLLRNGTISTRYFSLGRWVSSVFMDFGSNTCWSSLWHVSSSTTVAYRRHCYRYYKQLFVLCDYTIIYHPESYTLDLKGIVQHFGKYLFIFMQWARREHWYQLNNHLLKVCTQ